MAQMISLRQRCDETGCARTAKVEVLTEIDTSVGVFCTAHGVGAFQQLHKDEGCMPGERQARSHVRDEARDDQAREDQKKWRALMKKMKELVQSDGSIIITGVLAEWLRKESRGK